MTFFKIWYFFQNRKNFLIFLHIFIIFYILKNLFKNKRRRQAPCNALVCRGVSSLKWMSPAWIERLKETHIKLHTQRRHKMLLKSIPVRLSDQTWVYSVRPCPGEPTQRFSWRLVEPAISVISTVLPHSASMRPKVGGIGLSMAWGTRDSIFMVFGKIVILDQKVLVAAERDVLTQIWWYHRDQQGEYPLWGDCEGIWRTFLSSGENQKRL